MIRNYLLLIVLCAGTLVQAQSFEITDSEAALAFDETLDYDEVFVSNVGSETKSLACKLEKRCYNEDDGLQVQVCWGDQCFGPTNDDLTVWDFESILVTLAPGESTGDFSIHQFFVESYGSDWRVYFYDVNNPSDEVWIDLFIDECAPEDTVVRVEETSGQFAEFDFSPNPATNHLTVFTQGIGDQLVLMDLSGRTVHQQRIGSTSQVILLDGLNPGIYLVRLQNERGDARTQRLVVE